MLQMVVLTFKETLVWEYFQVILSGEQCFQTTLFFFFIYNINLALIG